MLTLYHWEPNANSGKPMLTLAEKGADDGIHRGDPQELREAIDRIPLESRRVAWRKALFNEFTAAELAESRRRVAFAVGVLERHLTGHTWIAGETYALPLSQPERCNDACTPRIMDWLRRIYERPAAKRGTGPRARRHDHQQLVLHVGVHRREAAGNGAGIRGP
jgi:hypothetical protein